MNLIFVTVLPSSFQTILQRLLSYLVIVTSIGTFIKTYSNTFTIIIIFSTGLSLQNFLTYLHGENQDIKDNLKGLHTTLLYITNASVANLLDLEWNFYGINDIHHISNLITRILASETEQDIFRQHICYCNGGHFRNNWFEWVHKVTKNEEGVVDTGLNQYKLPSEFGPIEDWPDIKPRPIHHKEKTMGIGYPVYRDRDYVLLDGITFYPKHKKKHFVPFTELAKSKKHKHIFKQCLKETFCPPLILHILLHGEESFLELPKLQDAQNNPFCSQLNYALYLESIWNEDLPSHSVYCKDNHILELIEWLSTAPKFTLLEIPNWHCLCMSDEMKSYHKECIKLFELVFHNTLQYIRIQSIADEAPLMHKMLLNQLPKMTNLQVLIIQHCETCIFDLKYHFSIKILELTRFSSVISLPRSVEKVTLEYNYQAVAIPAPNVEIVLDDNYSTIKNVSVSHEWNFTRYDKPENASFWINHHYPHLHHLRIFSYRSVQVDYPGFDSADFARLGDRITSGHFPSLRIIHIGWCNLSGSWDTLIKLLKHESMYILKLQHTNLTKADGKHLLKAIKDGQFLITTQYERFWDFSNNENLTEIEQDLQKAASRYNIYIYITNSPWQQVSPFAGNLYTRNSAYTRYRHNVFSGRYIP